MTKHRMKQLSKILFAHIALALVLCASSFIVQPAFAGASMKGTGGLAFVPNQLEINMRQEEDVQPQPLQPQFQARNIPLSADLQEYTWNLCQEYDVPFEVVLAVMEQESNFNVHVRDNVNYNGTRDRGLMQINSVNWSWLQAEGLDVNDTKQNIEAGVLILSRFIEKYPLEQSLVAYQCGEGRMKQKGLTSTGYSAKMLARSQDFALPDPAPQPEQPVEQEAGEEDAELPNPLEDESNLEDEPFVIKYL